ncbi:MAG: hypothetical protein IKL07_04735, partial [Clostridium sp.]|nr:hypothetical protein [Clostridium sp.]
MSEEKLLDAFGQIEEEFIEEADPEKRKTTSSKRSNGKWMKWAIYAACAVLALGVGTPLVKDVYLGNAKKSAEKAEPENAAGAPEAIQDNGDQDAIGGIGDGLIVDNEETEGLKNYWVA